MSCKNLLKLNKKLTEGLLNKTGDCNKDKIYDF